MLKLLKHKLVEHSIIYFLFDALNKGIPFLLLPVLTRYLETNEFGMVTMFSTLVNIIAVFAGLSVHGAVNVNFFQMEKKEFSAFVANALLILFSSSALIIFSFLILGHWIAGIFKIPQTWVLAATLVAASQFVTTINLVLWQVEKKPNLYGWYEFCLTLFNISLSLFLVIHQNMGWEGRVIGISGTTLIFSGISLYIIYKRGYVRFEFNKDHVKDGLNFGIPLIPHQLSGWVMTGVDRMMITAFVGLNATGIYSAGYQVAMILGIMVTAISRAFSPFLFEKLKTMDEPAKISFVRFSYLYFFFLILSAIILDLLSRKFLPIFLGIKFAGSAEVVLWVAMGYAFNGMYLVVAQFIFYEKKTHLLSLVSISVAIIHAGLCYVLVHSYGVLGAAYATTGSYIITFIFSWMLCAKVHPMPWLEAVNPAKNI